MGIDAKKDLPWSQLGALDCEELADMMGLGKGREKGKRQCVWCDSSDGMEVKWRSKQGSGVFCFACQQGGDAIDMWAAAYDCSKLEAAFGLADWAGIQLHDGEAVTTHTARIMRRAQRKALPRVKKSECVSVQQEAPDDREAATIHGLWIRLTLGTEAREYLAARGMDAQLCSALHIRSIEGQTFAKMWKWLGDEGMVRLGLASVIEGEDGAPDRVRPMVRAGVLVLPYHDETGRVINLRFRALPSAAETWSRHIRYYSQRGHQPTRPFLSLALNRAVRSGKGLYVCEGELNAIALRHYGLCAIASSGASTWREAWVEGWADVSRVVLVVDGDDAGERWAEKIAGDVARVHGFSFFDQRLDIVRMRDGLDAADLLKRGGLLGAIGEDEPDLSRVLTYALDHSVSTSEATRAVWMRSQA